VQVNILEAKNRLSKLIKSAQAAAVGDDQSMPISTKNVRPESDLPRQIESLFFFIMAGLDPAIPGDRLRGAATAELRFPAKAGVHSSAPLTAERWTPVFAGERSTGPEPRAREASFLASPRSGLTRP
jgi:hypothetical protein